MPDKKFATVRQRRRIRDTRFRRCSPELCSVAPLQLCDLCRMLKAGMQGCPLLWSSPSAGTGVVSVNIVGRLRSLFGATRRRLSTVALMDGPDPSKIFACTETKMMDSGAFWCGAVRRIAGDHRRADERSGVGLANFGVVQVWHLLAP